MPTPDETNSFLYLILTSNGPPQINWPPICTQFSINLSAANMRWYRVKQAMEAGKKVPLKESHAFLWALLKNSKLVGRAGDKATPTIDWKPIALKCNTTPGAAATRFYRMRKAWEKEKEKERNKHTGLASASTKVSAPPKQKQKQKRPPIKKPIPQPNAESISDDATLFATPEQHTPDSPSATLTTRTLKAEPDVDEASSVTAFRGFGREESSNQRPVFRGFGGAERGGVEFGGGVKDEGKKKCKSGEREDVRGEVGAWSELTRIGVERWLEEI